MRNASPGSVNARYSAENSITYKPDVAGDLAGWLAGSLCCLQEGDMT